MLIDYIIHLYLKYTHKRIDYCKYLKSRHWKKVKRKALKRSDYKCQVCSSRNGTLITHHNNYKCLYNEHSHDIIVVCSRCHEMIHTYIYVPKSKRKAS